MTNINTNRTNTDHGTPITITGTPRRISGGCVVRVETTLWNGSVHSYEACCCNVRNRSDNSRTFTASGSLR